MVGDGMWQRGQGHRRVANQGKRGGGEKRATAPWVWETSRHGLVNHGPTIGSLATGSQENALISGTALRCPQG